MTIEQALIRQLKDANPTAFRRVYDRYGQRVYQFALGYLRSEAAAEKVVRDVFSRLWEKRHTLDGELSLSGYLFTLSYHLVLAAFREQHSRCQPQEIMQRLTTRCGSPTEEHVLYQELELSYQRAVAQLSLRQREIYLLSRHEGMSERQIADRLHLSVSSVEEELHQAVRALRTQFDFPA